MAQLSRTRRRPQVLLNGYSARAPVLDVPLTCGDVPRPCGQDHDCPCVASPRHIDSACYSHRWLAQGDFRSFTKKFGRRMFQLARDGEGLTCKSVRSARRRHHEGGMMARSDDVIGADVFSGAPLCCRMAGRPLWAIQTFVRGTRSREEAPLPSGSCQRLARDGSRRRIEDEGSPERRGPHRAYATKASDSRRPPSPSHEHAIAVGSAQGTRTRRTQ